MKIEDNNRHEREVTLSLAAKNYDGTTVTYKATSIKIDSIESILKSHNYSPIQWHDDHRTAANFKSASGFCADIDKNLTLEQALEKLQRLGWNFALITTRSHTPTAHRFRIYIPFNKMVYACKNYNAIAEAICIKFPQCDPSVMDGARQLFGSPEDATYYSRWDGTDYDITPFIKDGTWDDSLRIFDGRNQKIDSNIVSDKTPILCPFHEDQNTSAFIQYSDKSDNYFIHCSACDETFWKIKEQTPMEKVCERFWSHSRDIYEFTIAGESFSMSAIGKEKFCLFVDALDKDKRLFAMKYLVDNKHIPQLRFVNHIGDPSVQKSCYEVDRVEGTVTVKYMPRPVVKQDNGFIEEYLENTFGQYKQVVKEWLAVYSYTNYQDLPTLILKGPRGSGKNTFAEMVYSIYPSLSVMWDAEKRNFTPEAEKKLLIADETVCDDREQYKLLKEYAGQKHVSVNKKYLPPYDVKNNMNIIVLSNSSIPVYVSRDEKPTSETNNQFFVFNFKPFSGNIDPELDKKLEERIGHYVRTELKTVYDGLDFSGKRYSINVPITPEEAGLFESNITEEESEIEKIVDKLADHAADPRCEYDEFLKKKLLPRPLIERLKGTAMSINAIVKQMREQTYLEESVPLKKQIDGKRWNVYHMTDKLFNQLKFYDPTVE